MEAVALLLWSINDRMNGGDGIDMACPDVPAMVMDFVELQRLENEAIDKAEHEALVKRQHYEAIGQL